MRRESCQPRPDWREKVESQGLHFHTAEGLTYWDESACYHFRTSEIDVIEKATYELYDLCLKAVENVVINDRWPLFQIPEEFIPWIKQSWEKDTLSIYGRFDFAYDGKGVPKLLEFNADTPTALLEAAAIQWFWLQDVKPGRDQFNTIHERLIEFWKTMNPPPEGGVHFVSTRGHLEDFMTANYLRDTAEQGGLKSRYMPIEDIGWNHQRRQFVDLDENVIRTCFKLYPWEWMIREQFAKQLLECRVRWFEPPWKMLLSNKAMMAVLWELYPECPYLLRAGFEPWNQTYVRKPVLGREGSNVEIVVNGQTVATSDGDYGEGAFVYQDVKAIPAFDGNYPVLGSWVVNGYACGLGIREDTSPITRNTSRFIPHYFGDGPPPLRV